MKKYLRKIVLLFCTCLLLNIVINPKDEHQNAIINTQSLTENDWHHNV